MKIGNLLLLRKAAALCIFVAFLFLFVAQDAALAPQLAYLAKIQIGPAILAGSGFLLVVLALFSLLFGRLYCSLLCPLGLLQDSFLYLTRKRAYQRIKKMRWLRTGILCLFALSLLTGLLLPYTILDPYSTFGRIASGLVSPLVALVQNCVAWLSQTAGRLALTPTFFSFPGWPAMLTAMAAFFLLLALTLKAGRAWCNYCPVGTALGFMARKSFLRIRLDADKCVQCGKCEKACKTGCIDSGNKTVDTERCVACFNCTPVCSKNALTYGIGRFSDKAASDAPPLDGAKRAFLRTMVGMAAASSLIPPKARAAEIDKLNRPDVVPARRSLRKREIPLTPPGGHSIYHFEKHCIGCQLCVAACPNNVLVTSLGSSGLLQPVVSYESGYCRPNCHRCGQVCPAGAIDKVTLDQKRSIQVGYAKVDFTRCIVQADEVQCTACQRICPSQAISLAPLKGSKSGLQGPVIDVAKCNGCGACEYVCPGAPLAAISVIAHPTHAPI